MNAVVGRNFGTALLVIGVLVLTVVAAGPCISSAAGKAVVEMRAGTPQPKGTLNSDVMDKLIDLVKQKTNGEVVVTNVYNSMGTEHVQADAVKAGSLDLGMLSNSNSARYSDAYLVWDLPFVFSSTVKMIQSLESSYGKAAFDRFEKDTGLKVLCPSTEGSGRDIQTRRKQLKVPTDIKGLKIRAVSTPVDLATFKAWGANPTPIDWGQTYTALQQGVADGLQIPISSVLMSKIYEVVKYNLEIEYQMVFQQIYINSKKLASLKPEHQKAINEAGRETLAWNKVETPRLVGAWKAELEKLGVVFYKPTPAEYKEWTSVRDSIWQSVASESKGKLDLDLAKKISASVE